MAKVVRKGCSAPASSSVRPLFQKPITMFIQSDTQQKYTLAILQAIADTRMEMKKDLERTMKNDLLKMDQKMEAFQQAMSDTQQRMQNTEDKSVLVDQKLDTLQDENQRLEQ